MLTNVDLENLAGFYKIHLNGIFMKDQMPTKPVNGCYIISLQSSTQGNGLIGRGFSSIKKCPIISIHSGHRPQMKLFYFQRRRREGIYFIQIGSYRI